MDLIWTVDAQLDEILGDVRSLLPESKDEKATQNAASTEPASKLSGVRQSAEKDKILLAELVQRLLVGLNARARPTHRT